MSGPVSKNAQLVTKAIQSLVEAHMTVFNAALEAATLAACLDGYRGDVWAYVQDQPDGGFIVRVQRSQPNFANLGTIRLGKVVTITEEGARALWARYAGEAPTPAPNVTEQLAPARCGDTSHCDRHRCEMHPNMRVCCFCHRHTRAYATGDPLSAGIVSCANATAKPTN